jgi:hypothetical protein
VSHYLIAQPGVIDDTSVDALRKVKIIYQNNDWNYATYFYIILFLKRASASSPFKRLE